ncbi:O-antigen ligase family protein [Pseudoalteromonas citrea]|uniref:O-antigen ligase family protein n=1 Tax=Pseudoalteromonas citrea TaxID=43655 RepID=UPI001EE1E92D|nr:O-antigen ligase family protein [Pseudoalteromonas citrea]
MTFGQLEIFIAYKITNVIQITLLSLIFVYLIFVGKGITGRFIYIVPLTIPLLILLSLAVGVNIFGDVSRIGFFLLFIAVPFFVSNCRLKFDVLVSYVIRFYTLISLLIVLDFLAYIFLGRVVLFSVVVYITPRFSGPFNDPNFMGFIFALLFLFVYFDKQDMSFVRRKVILLLFAFCVVLSGSATAVLLSSFSLIQARIFKVRYTFIKPVICIFISFVFVPVFVEFKDEIHSVFSVVVSDVFELEQSLIDIKFNSLLFRYESVYAAVGLIMENPFGYGYLTLLDYLPRDTHNSYIGMSFEYGVVMLLVITLSLFSINKQKSIDSITTFTCLSALFLNIHYMPIYFFVVIICFFNNYSRNGEVIK